LGVAAGFLAVLGIYGVTAYAVQQRRREIAIRMAVGATGGAVIRRFLRESVLVFAAGAALGLPAAIVASRVLANQVYGVRPFDVSILSTACLLLGTAGVLAIWWPARRATARNPIVDLKEG
jgi:ABC-type antimicrobial peptide transport system permease subunit